MENAVNRLNSILLKKNIQSITDNMTTCKRAMRLHRGGGASTTTRLKSRASVYNELTLSKF